MKPNKQKVNNKKKNRKQTAITKIQSHKLLKYIGCAEIFLEQNGAAIDFWGEWGK